MRLFLAGLAVIVVGGGVFLLWKDHSQNNESIIISQDLPTSPKEKVAIQVPEVPGVPYRICDIRDYGARNEDGFKSTTAIKKAIDYCAAQGGGSVVIPRGKWLTGAVTFKSRINLFLEEGAELSFTTDLSDYLPVVLTRFQGIEFYNYSPLIYGKDLEHVAITGKGKLIGNGEKREDWTGPGDFETARQKLFLLSRQGSPVAERVFGEKQSGIRPSFIQFVNTKDILLDGFTVENGPFWTIHPLYSENFVARNLHIETWSSNTDGIALDSTRNVLIENCFFSTGDDAISIKSGIDEDGRRVNRPTEHVRIRNITVVHGSSGVSIGSEMSGGVRDVEIRDSHFENTRHGFRLKTTESRGGFVEDVLVENITMDRMSGDALDINLIYSSALQTDNSFKPLIKNIIMRNISGTGAKNGVVNIDGMANPNMQNVRFENIRFTDSKMAVRLSHADQVTLDSIQVEAKKSPLYVVEDGQDILIQNMACSPNLEPCFQIGGGKTRNIVLRNIDKQRVRQFLEIVDHASSNEVRVE
jgi:polygalacturonase